MSALEALLRRERIVVTAGLTALTLIAWVYIWQGAGMGMSALEMTRLALFPHAQIEPVSGMPMSPEMPGIGGADIPGMPGMSGATDMPGMGGATDMPGMGVADGTPGSAMPDVVLPAPAAWLGVLAMWWIMMIAMMTPSAAPLVLLYGRVLRHANTPEPARTHYASSLFIMAGYLGAWLLFSAAAVAVQAGLQRAGLVSQIMLSSQSAILSASVLIAAGLYQLSSLKHACLRRCRGPLEFLTRRWRPGPFGAFAMGVELGAWCVGCCWMLMALLFVGGIMNVAWIALLAVLVLIEKIMPAGALVGRIVGTVLIAWGIATLAV